MQRLKVLLCLQFHPKHLPVSTAQPSLVTAGGKTQTKALVSSCDAQIKAKSEVKRSQLPSLLASKAFFIEPPKEKILTMPNKDALRILGCNRLHSKGVLITLIPQEELLPQ